MVTVFDAAYVIVGVTALVDRAVSGILLMLGPTILVRPSPPTIRALRSPRSLPREASAQGSVGKNRKSHSAAARAWIRWPVTPPLLAKHFDVGCFAMPPNVLAPLGLLDLSVVGRPYSKERKASFASKGVPFEDAGEDCRPIDGTHTCPPLCPTATPSRTFAAAIISETSLCRLIVRESMCADRQTILETINATTTKPTSRRKEPPSNI